MIDINTNGIIEASLLIICLAVLPWLGIFTALKLILNHCFLSSLNCCSYSQNIYQSQDQSQVNYKALVPGHPCRPKT